MSSINQALSIEISRKRQNKGVAQDRQNLVQVPMQSPWQIQTALSDFRFQSISPSDVSFRSFLGIWSDLIKVNCKIPKRFLSFIVHKSLAQEKISFAPSEGSFSNRITNELQLRTPWGRIMLALLASNSSLKVDDRNARKRKETKRTNNNQWASWKS